MIHNLHQWHSLGEILLLYFTCKEQLRKVLTGLQKADQTILIL